MIRDLACALKDLVDIVEQLGRATHDRLLAEGDLRSIIESLNDWLALWTGDKFEENLYRYLWGSRGCREIRERLALIEVDLEKVQTELDQFEDSLFQKAKHVLFKKSDIKYLIDGLEKQTKQLAATTWSKYTKEHKHAKIHPQDVATLAFKSEILSASLKSLSISNAESTLLAMLPDSEPFDRGKRYQESLWRCFKDDSMSLKLNTIKGRMTLKKWRIYMTAANRFTPKYQPVEDRNGGLSEVIIRSNLQQCLYKISDCSPEEQQRRRQSTVLDRVNAAVDIAEWNLLAWDSDWTAGLCICNLCCAFGRTNWRFMHPIFSMDVASYLQDHGCFTRRLEQSRHLLLAVTLSALALGCRIGVVDGRDGSQRFTADIDGELQTMEMDDLLEKVEARCYDDRWAEAIRHCLELDEHRNGGGTLKPLGFYYYDERVLEP